MNRAKMTLFLITTIVILSFSCTDEDFIPDKIILYKEGANFKLHLHLFYPHAHRVTEKIPAIIFFFGGGWVKGTPSQFYPHCSYFASRGMIAISAEYRIESKHGTSPFESVKDAKSAIRWLRIHASELGIDPNRIAAGGASAGGHIAAAAGTLEGFEESNENIGISPIPNALLLIYPVIDNGPGGYGHERVKERWEEFSPLHNINLSTPATAIFLGTKDNYISIASIKKHKTRMEKYNLRCDLFLYQGQKHGFCNHPSYSGFSDKYFRDVCRKMDLFLISLDFLKGAPTIGAARQD